MCSQDSNIYSRSNVLSIRMLINQMDPKEILSLLLRRINKIIFNIPGRESNRESPVTTTTSPTTTTKVKKAATFLTSESLKEIRNKLRRLSDESLYKDDILNSSNSSTSSRQSGSINGSLEEAHLPLTNESTSPLFAARESSAFVNYRDSSRRTAAPSLLPENSTQVEMNKFVKSDSNSSVGSNSTSSLQSNRNEWHSRRKSYGFEKMTPPAETMSSFNCMESSTDSGIGRSGDLASLNDHRNSPQSQQSHNNPQSAATKNGTIVRITNPSDNYQSYRSSFRNSVSSATASKMDHNSNPKRHSIAVADDQKYLNDNLKDSSLLNVTGSGSKNKSQASANGFNVIFNNNANTTTTTTSNSLAAHSKRVEFCKTEVHFAAESGRVNIVETDGKPPPTNNFRRRRSSTQFLPTSSSADEQELSADRPASNSKAVPAIAIPASTTTTTSLGTGDQPSVAGPKATVDKFDKLSRTNEEEVDSNDEVSLRGILKNKPIKPKPYHLGENCTDGESLWGVRLRPVSGDYTNWMPRSNHSSISLYKEPDSGEPEEPEGVGDDVTIC